MSQQTVVLLTLILYKVALLGIGFWAARRMRGEDDFFVGGRGVGGLVSGLSYAASTSSAWVLLGFSGFVYTAGLSALWMVPGILGGYVVMWVVIAPRLSGEARAKSHVTLTDYLTDGLGVPGAKAVAALSTALTLFCFVFYIAAQFDAAAKAFTDQFALGQTEALLLGAGVILIYSLMGGYWAVSVTDTLQGFVMAAVAIGLPLAALIAAGGPAGVSAALAAAPSDYGTAAGGRGAMAFTGFVLGVLAIGLGPFGQPHLHARLMSLKDEPARRRGFVLAMGWAVIVYAGMATLALAGRALTGGALADGEVLFYRLAADVLPPILAGIVIAAILSAVMSTVDSILLSAAASVAHDLGFTKGHPARALLISRSVMAAIAVLSVALALSLPDSIFNRVLFAWSALGAAFGPLVLARVAGRRPGTATTLLAIALGFGVTVLFYVLGTTASDDLLSRAARLDGDSFERLVPWVVPLALLFASPRRSV
ncbi:sodium/proline symporter [Parvularcula dongshanensis]|uniref:Sodium/proline symporter n=1 Tax=Parvularcula dongshanensis TaxID=1173995 RepID=A0A840I5M5_9PROT|nr:sodium/proline symporter [Parvularcula dongshanensis]